MWQKLDMRRVLSLVLGLLLTSASVACADEVTHWNEVLLNSIRGERTAPPAAARKMAITHIAIVDAVNSISKTHESYLFFVPAPKKLSIDAAIASAAHYTLSANFPQFQAIYDMELADSLSDIPDGPKKDTAVWLGRASAAAILTQRFMDPDGSQPPSSAPTPAPGVWKPTPNAFIPYLLPGWADMPPFAMLAPDQYRRTGVPSLRSNQYAKEFNRVKLLGRIDSTARTADQTEIALFWADGPGTETPPGHWNSIAQTVSMQIGLSSTENARLFALLNIALADAAIAAWDMKYDSYFWRPVTAIREADTDENSKTKIDTSWEPLIVTPPFPGYVSGHSTFSSTGATLLRRYFGTDKVRFSTTSDALPGVERHFESFRKAAAEAGQSRIYGGIHFDIDDKDGQTAGQQLGNDVFKQMLRKY
jgi:PAP2 superfamily